MEQKTKRRLYDFLPWVLTFAVMAAFTLFVSVYREGANPFETQRMKANLLSTMKIELHEAVESEKNAVLAINDQASEDFAAQARQAADRLENSRKQIESIIHRDKLPRETGMMNEFNACWSHYKKLDETILDLATQHTNFKAQKISATQCAEEMARFEERLNRLIHRNTRGSQCNDAVMHSYEALTASLNAFALHKAHIEEADDHVMDQIEQRIQSYDESAKKALGSLDRLEGLGDDEDLKAAEAAYGRFMDSTREVLRLSRLNTNIKSAELSLGKKRLIASQCQEILAALKETVQPQGDYSLPRSKIKGIE